VKVVGINFMDCLTAIGRVNKCTMGGECAGVVNRAGANCNYHPGDHVRATILDCFKTCARSDSQLVAKIPGNLSFAGAGSTPVTGVTAHYALIEFARLRNGGSILIHSATGGTGQLTVQIAQLIVTEVYATVG
jgi:NADPH:quinone reductase-like Zn-dependent oxidoreductase